MENTAGNPLVSVVLTTYNRQEFLPDAIKTVIEQTYDEIELVIVDDNSPESPRDIVENASTEGLRDVVFVRHKENRGASAARNTGIERASGEIIAFLDDDDRWKPTKIERQVDVLQNANSSVGAVYTGMRTFATDGSTITIQRVDKEGDLRKAFLCGFTPPFSSVVVKREVAADAGPFDEELPSWNDREWLLRAAQHGEFRVIDAPLVFSQREDGRDQLSGDYETKATESYPRIVEKFQPVAAEYGRLFKRKSHAHLTFDLGYAALANEKYEAARKHFLTASIRWPFAPKFFLYLSVVATGDRGYKAARAVKRKKEQLLSG